MKKINVTLAIIGIIAIEIIALTKGFDGKALAIALCAIGGLAGWELKKWLR